MAQRSSLSVGTISGSVDGGSYEQRGEFAAATELRRLFPGIADPAQARECARTIRRLEAAAAATGEADAQGAAVTSDALTSDRRTKSIVVATPAYISNH